MPRKANATRGLKVVRVAIDSLHEDPANARKHGDANRAAIRASLQEFGQVVPIVVLKGTGRVIGGNGTLGEMRRLGWTEADVVEFEGSETRATALAIALNRSAELAEWDDDVLKRTLASLRADDFNLDATGFDAAAVDALIDDALAGTEDETEHVEFEAGGGDPDDQPELHDVYEVAIECRDEAKQTALLEVLEAIIRGREPKIATIKSALEGATCRARVA